MIDTFSASLKELIQQLLRKAGYELNRKNGPVEVPRCSMHKALQWLSNNSFGVSTIFDVGASDGSWNRECKQFSLK